MLERLVIEQCAPTLAGMKTANLFSYYFNSKYEAVEELCELNHKLNERGVHATVLNWCEKRALVYVYRAERLRSDLSRSEISHLLKEYGYEGNDVTLCLRHLQERMKSGREFPHEIGLFLGYPPEDVEGFIIHKGEKCKFCGLWKVYSDEVAARKLFAKYSKCQRVYTQLFSEGRSIVRMTVPA